MLYFRSKDSDWQATFEHDQIEIVNMPDYPRETYFVITYHDVNGWHKAYFPARLMARCFDNGEAVIF